MRVDLETPAVRVVHLHERGAVGQRGLAASARSDARSAVRPRKSLGRYSCRGVRARDGVDRGGALTSCVDGRAGLTIILPCIAELVEPSTRFSACISQERRTLTRPQSVTVRADDAARAIRLVRYPTRDFCLSDAVPQSLAHAFAMGSSASRRAPIQSPF